jgi:hypothetical protein
MTLHIDFLKVGSDYSFAQIYYFVVVFGVKSVQSFVSFFQKGKTKIMLCVSFHAS